MNKHMPRVEVGEVRPSQILTTSGVGSLIDLPNLSVMVMGLDDWDVGYSTEIAEERLLRSAQSILGPKVTRLMTPPRAPGSAAPSNSNWFDESRQIGVPVAPFPRWLVCTHCRRLGPISSEFFTPENPPYRTDKACYRHNCFTSGKQPLAVPARFLVTCPHGHIDDFPWVSFVHRNQPGCNGALKLKELGPSGEMADVQVVCEGCQANRRLAEVIGPARDGLLPPCTGRRPHLRDFDPNGCSVKNTKAISLGASNLWFPVLISAVSIPQTTDILGSLVDEHWAVLDKATSREVVTAFRMIDKLPEFGRYSDDQIWEAVQQKREQTADPAPNPDDLKSPEWEVLSNPATATASRNFKLRSVPAPTDYSSFFEQIVLVEKMREVRTLVGFTRLTSPRDFDSPADLPPEARVRLARKDPTWLPASETRGEGIFFQFAEARVQAWVEKNKAYEREFLAAHKEWLASRNLDDGPDCPGIRYVLLHSFAHALIRQLAIECGYTSASITERIYSRGPQEGDPMAGVLIYTAASDSEGTLGGLSSLGEPGILGRHIRRALEKLRLCASDPLCSEHRVGSGATLHGAACHACTFLPETSCERGNKYLDRSALVATVERTSLAFFG